MSNSVLAQLVNELFWNYFDTDRVLHAGLILTFFSIFTSKYLLGQIATLQAWKTESKNVSFFSTIFPAQYNINMLLHFNSRWDHFCSGQVLKFSLFSVKTEMSVM